MTLYGMITGWNSGTERFCGYTTREVFGRWPIGITITEDELAKILKRVGRGERVNHYENIEVKKSGQRINVSVTVSPIRNTEGKVVEASLIARDMTPRKQAEAAICERDALRYVASLDSRAALARARCCFDDRRLTLAAADADVARAAYAAFKRTWANGCPAS